MHHRVRRHHAQRLRGLPHEKLKNIFGEYLQQTGPDPASHCGDGKYAHVTFFFNGGQEEVFPGEDRCLIPPQGSHL
ncbi:MAG: hypothetical protein ACLR1T_02285 [Evtepia gabavorous]